MALTKMANMINPEVMGDMINAKIGALLKLTPYAKVDTTLNGVPGDTITVPSWKYIGDAEDVAEGVEITPSEMKSSKTSFKIKKAMKCVSITQEAVNSGYGNPIGQANTQLAKSIAGKVDNDVLEAAYTASMTSGDGTATISYGGIVDANCKFEDEEDGIDKVMFIHPAQEGTLLKDANFISADKYQAGVAVNGSIGKIAGAWVKKSNKVRLITYEKESGTTTGTQLTTDELVAEYQAKVDPRVELAKNDYVKKLTKGYYLCPVIKLEPDSAETEMTEEEAPALTIFLKKDTQTDAEWLPKKQQHDITSAKYYGVALTNDAKVVLAKFKA